jgi:hypothetical protein
MPLPPRKVSGKIQVLVEKFDGLAKAAEEEPTIVKRGRSVTPHPPDGRGTYTPTDDTADFGDFEDAAVIEEERPVTPASHEPRSVEATPERAPTSHTNNDASLVVQSSATGARGVSGTTDTVSSDVRQVASKFDNVKFNVDAALVENLFKDGTPGKTESDMSSADVPDYPITDSFTDMSERKVWYRISRQGSSRKHNFGDWDSYRRITWQSSALHADVLKIVRRWMEQDSITGRTTLGGGTTKTDIFGWDSGAEPVALEKVFARRHRPVERPMSLQQPLQMSPVSPVTSVPANRKPSAGQRPLSLAGPPATAFGWSSSPVESQQVEAQKPTQTQKSVMPVIQSSPQVEPIVTPITIAPSATQQVEEEDDWGEMVSSPVEAPKATPLDAIFHSPTQAAPPPTSHIATTRSDMTNGEHTNIPLPPAAALPDVPVQPPPPTEGPGTFNDLSFVEGPAKPPVDTSITSDEPTFTPTTALHVLSPSSVSVSTPTDPIRSIQPDEEDSAETERMIRQVVGSLPNLSYMLK